MSYFDNCRVRFLNINGGDMPDSEYYALKGYTSISRLKLLNPRLGGSPQKYIDGFDFGYNESLLLGTVVHSQILQPNEFELSNYEGKPSGKLGLFVEKVFENRQSGMNIVDSINKASIDSDYYAHKFTNKIREKAIRTGLDYYLHILNGDFKSHDGKEVYVLSKKLLDSAHACLNSVNRNQAIQSILKDNIFEPKQYFNEIALFSDIEVTLPDGKQVIIKFKGKLDSVVWDPEKRILYLNDVKTTSKSIDYFMDHIVDEKVYEGVFSHHTYYQQLAKIMAL